MTEEYKNSLSVTSQFSFCGLPFRMDTYSGCAFSCTYCFARLRGGNVPSKKLRCAESDLIIKKFKSARKSEYEFPGIISEYIKREMPVHFGGMSDPFQPIEKSKKVSLRVLEYLCSINYPIIISTKSNLLSQSPYLNVLKSNPKVLVQFSLSTTIDNVAKLTEPFSTPPSELLRTIEALSKNGIKTSVRWQPYIPNVSEDPYTFISNIAKLGIRHLGFEHLKLPVEKNNPLIHRLLDKLSFDLIEYYKRNNCLSDGREFILPVSAKIDIAKQIKAEVKKYKISFGAADNEIQYLSDTYCCCSGADQFEEFDTWNKFNIAHAIKKSEGGRITFDLIKDEWYPKGSIDKHLNSKSRISKDTSHNTVMTYILDRWENLNSPFNPTKFHGIIHKEERDMNGYRIYEWNCL